MSNERLSTDELMEFLDMSHRIDWGSKAREAIYSRLCAADRLYEASIAVDKGEHGWEYLDAAIANYENPEWKTLPVRDYPMPVECQRFWDSLGTTPSEYSRQHPELSHPTVTNTFGKEPKTIATD